jgi:hypothetical protein
MDVMRFWEGYMTIAPENMGNTGNVARNLIGPKKQSRWAGHVEINAAMQNKKH